MVTTRGNTDFATLQITKSKEWFDKFGRNDITLNKNEIVKGADGRPTSISSSSSTIIGDLQFNTKLLSEYIQLGIAQSGDGVFYTTATVTINKNDEIVVDSITWRLIEQVEAEQTNGITIYQGWICRRNP